MLVVGRSREPHSMISACCLAVEIQHKVFPSFSFQPTPTLVLSLFNVLVVTGATDGIGKAYAEEVRFQRGE